MQVLWDKVTDKLRSKLSTPGYKTFVSSTKIVSFQDGVLTLAIPTQFVQSWVKERCEPVLQTIFQEEFQQPVMFNYIINPDFNFGIDSEKESEALPLVKDLLAASLKKSPNNQDNPVFNPQYTFDTYVVGNNNRFAHAAAIAVAEKPSKAYNPLFTCGGSGLGKTHLMHAISQRALEINPSLKIVFVKAEAFVNELIEIIQEGSKPERMQHFRNKFRTADVLLIDDIQFLMGKTRSQEEFFHAFNTLYETKKQIIINSDRPPRELNNIEDRLKSRFSWGLITDIQPPDIETRIAILRKKTELDSIIIPDDVLQFIAKQVPSNVRDLEGALTRIIAHASLTNTPITIEFAAETLKNLFSLSRDKHITISVIKQIVSEYFKIDVEELSAKVRTKDIAMARQIAMFLAKEMTPSALTKIGSNFGGRDHTTVLHACDKIKELIKTDSSLLDLITRLKKDILSRSE